MWNDQLLEILGMTCTWLNICRTATPDSSANTKTKGGGGPESYSALRRIVHSTRVRSHAPSIQSHRGTKVVWPDFQPMRVPEEPVCIDLFRQNPVFTSLHLKSPVHVHRLSQTGYFWRNLGAITPFPGWSLVELTPPRVCAGTVGCGKATNNPKGQVWPTPLLAWHS